MEEKKKILYIITKGNFGGAQRYVYDLATNLPTDKFEAVVACGIKEGDQLTQKLTEKNIRIIPLEDSEREINLKKDLTTVKSIIKIVRAEKPDVVHFNSSKAGLLGALSVLYLKFLFVLYDKNPVPLSVFTSHGWAFNERHRSALAKVVFYVGHYLTVLICDQTIAVSTKTKEDISFLPFLNQKIKVIYNGIEKFDLLPKEESRPILNRGNSSKVVIFSLSELHPNKGLDVALKAFSLLPAEIRKNLVYTIAGDGEQKTALENLAAELKVADSVNFLGFVDDAKKLLSGADVFLLPSRTENMPFAVLEAGCVGLPIIATSVGGVSEVIHDMQNGILVHPQNPKEIAEAILYFLDHQDKAGEFGREIKKTITNFFTLERMLSETVKLYQ